MMSKSDEGVFCADGYRHYCRQQIDWFGKERLIAQADFAGCGPHQAILDEDSED